MFQPFKVIEGHYDFGTSRKHAWTLVRHSKLVLWSYLAPIYWDIAGFTVIQTPPPFHPNFGGVPIAPDRPCYRVSVRRCLRLFGREIIFEVFQPMWSRYLNVTDGQTTYCRMTALCILH